MAGWLDKYNDGGPVQENYNDYSISAPEGFEGDGYSNAGRNFSPAWGGQFDDGGELPNSNLPIYYGPTTFENCVGAGCSKIATTEAANLFGLSYNQLAPQDAWYKKAAVLKNKGKEVWTPKSKDYSNVKIGDFVSLDRPGNDRKDDVSTTPGYRLSDNEGNEHEGIVIGRDEKGIPLIKHGSEHGKIHVQPITKLYLDDAGPSTLNYTPLSIYRAASTENLDIKNKKYYTKPEKAINTNWNNPIRKPTKNEKNYIDAINKNASLQQQVYGLTPEEAKRLNNISYGIFHNESEAGESSTPIGGKMILSALAHAFGRDASPSLGDVQVKFDDLAFNKDKSLSNTGRMMRDVGVNRDGLYSPMGHREDYNDEVNAVSASLATSFNKIKNNPNKYKYNAEKNTIYGDIPVDQALATIYRFGPSAFKESILRDKKSYGKNAIAHMKDIDESLSKKPIGTHKGQPLYIKKPDGKYAMGGSLPGAVGFMYARTNDPAPSNGPYAKKTKASAENGTEMKFYQEGLDWKPKSISKNGDTVAYADNTRVGNVAKYQRPGYNNHQNYDGFIKAADVATDIMQLGHFIPHPIPQGIAFVGDFLGAPIDAYQAIDAATKGNYIDAGLNTASAFLPSYLKSKGYLRDMNNATSGSMAAKIAKLGSKDGNYRPLTALPRLINNPVVKKGIKANRSVAGALAAETAYDQYEQGGQLTKLDQLTNFTNYNTKQPGGWLDKYSD